MIGFSFFMFEGIGGVMPLMGATKNRENFSTILAYAMGFLCIIYIMFANLCYYTYGESLEKPIIMEMMPADNKIIMIVKFLFIINLVFSYPLIIFITNLIIESYTFPKSVLKGKPNCRKYMKNVERSFVLLIGIVLAIYFDKTLDKLSALSGSILGTNVVMILPCTLHYKLVAKT